MLLQSPISETYLLFYFLPPSVSPNLKGYVSPAPLPQVDHRKQTSPGLGQGYTAALNTFVLKFQRVSPREAHWFKNI